jgi:hypothetical protein
VYNTGMPNPWSLVSAVEYEALMGPGGTGELAPLAALFAKLYAARRPRRLAVLGVATGHGLEHVDPRTTSRVVGVDVNLSFLAVARQRHLRLGPRLELFCAELARAALEPEGFDLVHAPLALERADAGALLPRLAGWVAPGGACSIVARLPGGEPPPAATPAARAVAESDRLVSPDVVRGVLAGAGLVERRAYEVPRPGGRWLFVGLWEKPAK